MRDHERRSGTPAPGSPRGSAAASRPFSVRGEKLQCAGPTCSAGAGVGRSRAKGGSAPERVRCGRLRPPLHQGEVGLLLPQAVGRHRAEGVCRDPRAAGGGGNRVGPARRPCCRAHRPGRAGAAPGPLRRSRAPGRSVPHRRQRSLRIPFMVGQGCNSPRGEARWREPQPTTVVPAEPCGADPRRAGPACPLRVSVEVRPSRCGGGDEHLHVLRPERGGERLSRFL